MKYHLAWIAVGFALPTALASPAGGQSASGSFADRLSSVSLYEENDVFAGTDRHYTQGLKLTLFTTEQSASARTVKAADKLWRLLGPKDTLRRLNAGWALGQNMYTPEDIERVTLDPDDRPWAGWLYLGRALQVASGCTQDGPQADPDCREQQVTAELDVGVVGPWAQAEWAQSAVHRLINSPKPLGWDNQLDNEPGVLLFGKKKWRFVLRDRFWDVIPHAGAALGNVLTYASAGGTMRIGWNLGGFGSDQIPSLAQVEPPVWEAHLFAGGDARAVAVNIFLDGNHFQDSHSVDKRPFVYDLTTGFLARYKCLQVVYTLVRRSPELEPPSGRHLDPQNFGSLVISWVRWVG